jgi:glycerol kinase
VLLSIDQGTSSTKACLYAPPGELLGQGGVAVSRRTLADGSIVQDPRELVASCREAARRALDDGGVRAAELEGVAMANQGESFLLVDADWNPLTPVIGWQDSLVGGALDEPGVRDNAEEIRRRTGLPLHAEFVAPRLAFRLGQLGNDARRARLATLDTWLINQLAGESPFITDRATASRTMLIGLDADDWDEELISWFGLHRDLLPGIVPCEEPAVELLIDGAEVPLLASSYDMGLALLGQGCFELGDAKATFGTCLGVMAATGSRRVDAEGLLTTIAYTRGGTRAMALDGEIAAAGALIEWALGIGLAGSAQELDELAGSVEDSGGVVLVPAITGLGAPHWRHDARAAFTGMSSATEPGHLARAVYRSIGWSIRDVCDRLREAGVPADRLRVDGGLTWSRRLMQQCADICQVPLVLSAQPEATAYGGAALAWLAAGKISETQVRELGERGAETVVPEVAPDPAEAVAWEASVRRVIETSEGEAL